MRIQAGNRERAWGISQILIKANRVAATVLEYTSPSASPPLHRALGDTQLGGELPGGALRALQ
jgi:hypothetical protein